MTRILILAPKYPPDSGGASIYFQQVVELLGDTEFDVTVFAPRHPDEPYASKEHGAIIYRAFPSVGARFYTGLKELDRFHWLLKRVDPDIAHVHPHFPQYRWFRYLLKAHRVPRVYDCRDQDFTPWYVRDGQSYLSATETIDELLISQSNVDPDSIHRAPVVVSDMDTEPAALGEGNHIAFVGDTVEHKGIRIAVRAIQKLSEQMDITLHVAGRGTLVEWVASKADECIQYHGEVPHRKALGLIEASDALLMPSLREGRPRVALEAMALGTPVVSTGAGDLPDVIDGAGLIVNRDCDSFAQGVESVLSNRTFSERAENRGVSDSPDELREGLLQAYRSVLG